jgi:hypothetical protein
MISAHARTFWTAVRCQLLLLATALVAALPVTSIAVARSQQWIIRSAPLTTTAAQWRSAVLPMPRPPAAAQLRILLLLLLPLN